MAAYLVVAGHALAQPGMPRDEAARRQAVTVAEPIKGLTVFLGAVNGARIERNGKVLAIYGDPRERPAPAEMVLFTHHRRDATWAGRRLVDAGAKAVVSAAEATAFTQVGDFWRGFWTQRFHDMRQQTTKVLTEPMSVSQQVRGGQTITWEGLRISVLDTPGYTAGSVSYLAELDGRRVGFSGDLIYGDGRILDLYSFQDAIPALNIDGYHGYAARLADEIASLRSLAAARPDVLIPARGPIIREPAKAIETLIGRIQALYANYLSTDAARLWEGDANHARKAQRVLGADARIELRPKAPGPPSGPPWVVANALGDGPMFQGQVGRLPAWIVPLPPTAKLILAGDGAGFLIDCGFNNQLEALRKLKAAGKLKALEHVFVTHAHDDHTDKVAKLVEEFGPTVHAVSAMRDILENPRAYRIPCLTESAVLVTGRHADGEAWRWKEFELTKFAFPGQTLYHGALLATKTGGETVFFIGDSFTRCGMDDYCLQNRNLLGEGKGYFLCLDVLRRRTAGALLVNSHIDETFRFSPRQFDQMRQALVRRVALLKDLLPWDDPNFGLDEGWVRFYPYGLELEAGQEAEIQLKILNHSPRERTFHVLARAPAGSRIQALADASLDVPAGEERALEVKVAAPKDVPPGVHVLTADIRCDDWDLREWAEAIVRIKPGG